MVKYLLGKIANYRRARKAIIELSKLSEHELKDLGITRSDIPRVVAEIH